MKPLFVRLVLALALAAVAIGVSHRTQHGNLANVVAVEHKILAGEPLSSQGMVLTNLYNRILFPFVFAQASRMGPAGLDPGHLFVALRFVAFAVCFFLMFSSVAARERQADLDGMAVSLVAGVAFIATLIHHPAPQTSDIFDLTLMFYVFLFIMEGRAGPAFAVACLTAVNRETGAFAGVAYFLLRAGQEGVVRLLDVSAAFAAVPYALAIAVRKATYQGDLPSATFGQWLTGVPLALETMAIDLGRLNPANGFYVMLAMFALPAVMLARRPTSPAFKARVALAALAIFGISLLFGLVREIRVFLPVVSLLLAASVASIAGQARSRGLSSA